MYEERFYRLETVSKFSIEVSYKESDLLIYTDKEIDRNRALAILKKYYGQLEDYIEKNPKFLTSLSPLEVDTGASPIVKDMANCAHRTKTGPFASVAGAVASYVGREILEGTSEVIIENGGDLFLKINRDITVEVYLGERFKINNLLLRVKKRDCPFGIASSSSSMGHSLSLGRPDLVTVLAKDAIVADGFATSFCNRIKKEKDIDYVLEKVKAEPSIDGLLVFFEGKFFLWGDIEIAA